MMYNAFIGESVVSSSLLSIFSIILASILTSSSCILIGLISCVSSSNWTMFCTIGVFDYVESSSCSCVISICTSSFTLYLDMLPNKFFILYMSPTYTDSSVSSLWLLIILKIHFSHQIVTVICYLPLFYILKWLF